MVSRVVITPSPTVIPTTSLVTPSASTTFGTTESDDDLSTGAIIGIILSVLVGVVLITIVVVLLARWLVPVYVL